ncbi:substrate-binding domain-containing protein [Paenarthrobacter sp. NPDC089322]|uniref:sugar ABC transporter substrate-binding protein n=1 Tax=Paenarthrobacter sp. NPDC089322 TaxID=3155065 RepID=UPI00344029F8
MTTTTSAGLFTALLLVAVPACSAGSSSQSAEDDSVHVAFANISDQASQFRPISDSFKTYAQKLQWGIETYDNAFDASASLNNAKLMADSEADVLIDFTSVDGVQPAISQTFAAAGKKCIAMNTAIEGCSLFNISNEKYGADAGSNLAAEAVKRGWTANDTTFIAVNYAAGGSNPQGLASSSYEAFSSKFPGLTRTPKEDITSSTTTIGENFVQIDGKATLADSSTALRDALQLIPPGRHLAITTVNDDEALGVLAALESTGRTNDALLASTGSSPDGLKNLRENPIWISEGAVYLNYWAGYSLAMAKAMMDGHTPPELTVAPQNTLTKENVDEFFKDGIAIKAPAPDESSKYLLDTGVLQKLGLAGS